MNSVLEALKKILLSKTDEDSFGTFLRLINDKEIAKLGDSITNFFYSVAKTVVIGKATGTKVSDTILDTAYKSTEQFQTMINLNGRRGILADKIEATILTTWLLELASADEIITILIHNLDPGKLKDYIGERETASRAFASLLDIVAEKLETRYTIRQQ